MNPPLANCVKCGKPVTILFDGSPKRSCDHNDAGINVFLSATLYGDSSISVSNPDSNKSIKQDESK